MLAFPFAGLQVAVTVTGWVFGISLGRVVLLWWYTFPGFLPTGMPFACVFSKPCFEEGVWGFSYFRSLRFSFSSSTSRSTSSSKSLSFSRFSYFFRISAALIFADKNNHPFSQVLFGHINFGTCAKLSDVALKVPFYVSDRKLIHRIERDFTHVT